MYKRNSAYNNATGEVSEQEYKKLPAGGHLVGLVKAFEESSNKGDPMIRIEFDVIDEGEFKYFYSDQAKRTNYWPYNAMYYVMIPSDEADSTDKRLNMFKHFMDVLEKSNPGKKYWSENGELLVSQFRGSRIGGVFGEEGYYKDGQVKYSLKMQKVITIDDYMDGNYTVPARKEPKQPSQPKTAAPMVAPAPVVAPPPVSFKPTQQAYAPMPTQPAQPAFTPIDESAFNDTDLPF